MQIQTVTYQRVLNLGNYESKRLEMTAEISQADDLEFETSFLMEMVERKIREDAQKQIEAEIRQLRKELAKLKKQKEADPNPDDIPFKETSTTEIW